VKVNNNQKFIRSNVNAINLHFTKVISPILIRIKFAFCDYFLFPRALTNILCPGFTVILFGSKEGWDFIPELAVLAVLAVKTPELAVTFALTTVALDLLSS
jgi:hypothetical protein